MSLHAFAKFTAFLHGLQPLPAQHQLAILRHVRFFFLNSNNNFDRNVLIWYNNYQWSIDDVISFIQNIKYNSLFIIYHLSSVTYSDYFQRCERHEYMINHWIVWIYFNWNTYINISIYQSSNVIANQMKSNFINVDLFWLANISI